MDERFKKIIIPFILIIIFDLGFFYTYNMSENFGGGLSPHVGLLVIVGLILGPYGAIGATIGNLLCDLIRGYDPIFAIFSEIIAFGISYLGYVLWYQSYGGRIEVTNPKLNNTNNVLLFIAIIFATGIVFSILNGKLFYLFYPQTISLISSIEFRYFLNFINAAFIFGIIGIWISNKRNFFHIPKTSKKEFNEKHYKILRYALWISLTAALVIDMKFQLNSYIVIAEFIIILLILFLYIRKPITSEVHVNNIQSIPEDMMNIFQLAILCIAIIGIIISSDPILIEAIDNALPLNQDEVIISMLVLVDIILLMFLIPSLAVLRYVEMKVIDPILSFSKIENFIHENEKIEFDGLVELYSDYVSQKNEIGNLARSYTNLINFNNNYIENIHEIEGEKKRIEAELEIATKIQEANLPTEAFVNDDYVVDGYSKAAKEVGGDFFDYYPLDDENFVIMIGDASGKGVPAAILAMSVHVLIKTITKHQIDPSKVLYALNNQLCENNPTAMFLTLFLGIYNKKTKKLTFSNAGHNLPLVEENGQFKYLNIDPGIALGILEDYDYINEEISLGEEIVIYTDGITDADNADNEMYGEERLLNFFNGFKSKENPIVPLLEDISKFTQNKEQFDDMTMLYFMIKND